MNAVNYKSLKSYSHSLGVDCPEELFFFPKFIQIETVAGCNASCIMCPVKSVKREVSIMSDDLFEKITNELSGFAHWIQRVTIQLDGEPLLDKKLENRIRILKNIGMKEVFFSSNASLMDEGRAESIIRSGINQVDFSFDGATPETFQAIRGGLSFDECMKNIKNFIKIRNKLNPHMLIRIRVTVQDLNKNELEAIVLLWRKHLDQRDHIYGKLLHNWMNWMQDYILPIEQEGLNSRLCTSLWSSFVILADGRVPLCCSDFNSSILLGRIQDSAIQDIWHGAITEKVRRWHLSTGRNSLKLCEDCNVWDASSRIDLERMYKQDAAGSSEVSCEQ